VVPNEQSYAYLNYTYSYSIVHTIIGDNNIINNILGLGNSRTFR